MKHGVSMQSKKWSGGIEMCFSELLEMLRSNLEMSHSHAVTIFCKKFQLTLL